jgi:Tfp pilus assembly protein PilV
MKRYKHFMVKSNNAFSLVEVSLASLVLAIGICSILSIFPAAMKWGSSATSDNTGAFAAASLASKMMSEYLNTGSNLPASGDYLYGGSSDGYNVKMTSTVEDGSYYCVKLEVQRLVNGTINSNVIATYKTYVYDN